MSAKPNPNKGTPEWWRNPLNGMLIVVVGFALTMIIGVAAQTGKDLTKWLAWFTFLSAALSIIGFIIDYKGPKKGILNAADGVNYGAFWIILLVAGIALLRV